MFNIQSVKCLALLISVGLLYSCSTETSVDQVDRLLQQKTSNEETTVSLEEVRGEDGVHVIGYLEKVELPSDTPTARRYIFYVYDGNHDEVIEGMILDNGTAYRRAGNDSLERIGFTGTYEGVRKILSYDGAIQFYQNGRQISRGPE